MTHSTPTVSPFRGGITLAPNKLKLGRSNPIKAVPLPPLLKFNSTEPLVHPGDIVMAGQCIALDTLASTSGRISKIHRNKSQSTIELIPDGAHTLSPHIANAPDTMAAIEASGLKGLGGAGFSTSAKLHSQQHARLSTLVINAAECEPMIACDEALMLNNAAQIVSGIHVLMDITACKQCIIAIEDNKQDAISAIKEAIAQANTNPKHRQLHLAVVPTRYPGGAETVLLRQLTGAQLLKNQLPADHDLLCFNVATAYSVQLAAKRQPVFGRIVTIAGDATNKPCNVHALFGTPLDYLLKNTGNLPNNETATHVSIKIGGPISGQLLDSAMASLSNTMVTAKCNAIIIDHLITPSVEQACIRCGDCADVCPESLLPQQLFRYQDDHEQLNHHFLQRCIECRCCDLVCPSDIPLTHYFKQSKQALYEQHQIQEAAHAAEARFAAREQRLARKAVVREQELQEQKRQANSTPAVLDIKAALARAKNKASTANKPSNEPSNKPT